MLYLLVAQIISILSIKAEFLDLLSKKTKSV